MVCVAFQLVKYFLRYNNKRKDTQKSKVLKILWTWTSYEESHENILSSFMLLTITCDYRKKIHILCNTFLIVDNSILATQFINCHFGNYGWIPILLQFLWFLSVLTIFAISQNVFDQLERYAYHRGPEAFQRPILCQNYSWWAHHLIF